MLTNAAMVSGRGRALPQILIELIAKREPSALTTKGTNDHKGKHRGLAIPLRPSTDDCLPDSNDDQGEGDCHPKYNPDSCGTHLRVISKKVISSC
jgi:hypothetical protein